MEPQKLNGISKWPPPENITQLRSFLGFCNFYHQFVKGYADLCVELNKLLKKDSKWNWMPECQEAFDLLKLWYVTQSVLTIPDYNKLFIIEANASLFVTGGVLLQEDSNGALHPCAYLSKTLSPAK